MSQSLTHAKTIHKGNSRLINKLIQETKEAKKDGILLIDRWNWKKFNNLS